MGLISKDAYWMNERGLNALDATRKVFIAMNSLPQTYAIGTNLHCAHAFSMRFVTPPSDAWGIVAETDSVAALCYLDRRSLVMCLNAEFHYAITCTTEEISATFQPYFIICKNILP
ncbi:MAG: hypothetical protein AAFP93_01240 [Bacteroidota bacterium]